MVDCFRKYLLDASMAYGLIFFTRMGLILIIVHLGVPVVAQWLNPTRNHEVACLIPTLAQWVRDLALP